MPHQAAYAGWWQAEAMLAVKDESAALRVVLTRKHCSRPPNTNRCRWAFAIWRRRQGLGSTSPTRRQPVTSSPDFLDLRSRGLVASRPPASYLASQSCTVLRATPNRAASLQSPWRRRRSPPTPPDTAAQPHSTPAYPGSVTRSANDVTHEEPEITGTNQPKAKRHPSTGVIRRPSWWAPSDSNRQPADKRVHHHAESGLYVRLCQRGSHRTRITRTS